MKFTLRDRVAFGTLALVVACTFAIWLGSIFAPPKASAQGMIPGQRVVPLGYCQIATVSSSVGITATSCVRGSFTGTGSGTNLTTTSVSGVILVGDGVVGTGVPAGTTIVSQTSGTVGGAGVYVTSAATTSSSASLTSGGIPPGATMASLEAETQAVRYRDDGGVPTASVGQPLPKDTPILYTGTLASLRFIEQTSAAKLNISFYR